MSTRAAMLSTLWALAPGLAAAKADPPVAEQEQDYVPTSITTSAPNSSDASTHRLLASDINEDFDDAEFGASLDGFNGWSTPFPDSDVSFSSLGVTLDPVLGGRTPEVTDTTTNGAQTDVLSPHLGAPDPGAVSVDVVIRIHADDVTFLGISNPEAGFLVARLAFRPDGEIEILDVDPADPDGEMGVFVPTGRTWTEGEVMRVGLITLPEDKVLFTLDGEPVALTTNFAGARADDPGFQRIRSITLHNDADGDRFGFDNVVTNRFEQDPACVGDLNKDGVVDGADLGTLLGAWGPCM